MILHVLNYHNIEVDYMVGAQLDGFDTMVHLTSKNEFIVLEGDEYLSSPIDRRPKFHLYKPNIALISGIAWDHINVFPTFENYIEQFSIFTNSLINGGIMVYNEEDKIVKKIVEETENSIKKYPYKTPNYTIESGTTFIDTPEGKMPLEFFGEHNLQNMAGAKWICQNMGVGEDEFYEAIANFKGANKRLEKIAENKTTVVFKDFAHSPSKVEATTNAVKKQYQNRKVVACLELHTYSSLNANFLKQYEGTLNNADVAVVFYTPSAVEIKQLNPISANEIRNAFKRKDLIVYTNPSNFKAFVFNQDFKNTALLLMSSGNYGGLDFNKFKEIVH
jgi:UDP-N-acetylmuramate: L-alanyl-gamma-D-glutamyl-meso-diaminopimelate ligase